MNDGTNAAGKHTWRRLSRMKIYFTIFEYFVFISIQTIDNLAIQYDMLNK